VNSRVGAKAGAFGIRRMHALVAPAIGRTHIAIAFNRLSATTPQRFISRSLSDTLYFRAFVVVADETAAIIVLDIKVALMATDTMKRRGNDQVGKEGGKIS